VLPNVACIFREKSFNLGNLFLLTNFQKLSAVQTSGGEPIYYHRPRELCIIAGEPQNQVILSWNSTFIQLWGRATSPDLLSKYLLTMELRFNAILYSNFGNEYCATDNINSEVVQMRLRHVSLATHVIWFQETWVYFRNRESRLRNLKSFTSKSFWN